MFFRKKNEELDEVDNPKKKSKEKIDDGLVWDKKRIVVSLIILLFLVIAAGEVKNRFFPDTKILGESTVKRANDIDKPEIDGPNLDLKTQVNSSLDNIKESIGGIDPEEVASSSPQIQKVLRDIQSIRNLPTEKAKNVCQNICSSL